MIKVISQQDTSQSIPIEGILPSKRLNRNPVKDLMKLPIPQTLKGTIAIKTMLKTVFIFLITFLALSAMYGGGALIVAPKGGLLGLPVTILENSPFDSFLVPGIILFTVLGCMPLLTAATLIKHKNSVFAENLNFFTDMKWPWSFSFYTAFALIIWLQIQMMLINSVSWLHTFYMFLAVAIIAIGLLPSVRNSFKKSS